MSLGGLTKIAGNTKCLRGPHADFWTSSVYLLLPLLHSTKIASRETKTRLYRFIEREKQVSYDAHKGKCIGLLSSSSGNKRIIEQCFKILRENSNTELLKLYSSNTNE